jgi:hypothetical protein
MHPCTSPPQPLCALHWCPRYQLPCLTAALLLPPARFARQEYLRLAVEDDADDMQVDGSEDLYLGQVDGGAGGRFI